MSGPLGGIFLTRTVYPKLLELQTSNLVNGFLRGMILLVGSFDL